MIISRPTSPGRAAENAAPRRAARAVRPPPPGSRPGTSHCNTIYPYNNSNSNIYSNKVIIIIIVWLLVVEPHVDQELDPRDPRLIIIIIIIIILMIITTTIIMWSLVVETQVDQERDPRDPLMIIIIIK